MNTISLHSFHCTPVCNPTLRGFPTPQRPVNDFNNFYQTQPRSMYEFETDPLTLKQQGAVPFERLAPGCSSRINQGRGTLVNPHRNTLSFESNKLQQLNTSKRDSQTPDSVLAQTARFPSTDDVNENSNNSLNNLNRTPSTPRTLDHVISIVETNGSETKTKLKSNYVDISMKQ